MCSIGLSTSGNSFLHISQIFTFFFLFFSMYHLLSLFVLCNCIRCIGSILFAYYRYTVRKNVKQRMTAWLCAYYYYYLGYICFSAQDHTSPLLHSYPHKMPFTHIILSHACVLGIFFSLMPKSILFPTL